MQTLCSGVLPHYSHLLCTATHRPALQVCSVPYYNFTPEDLRVWRAQHECQQDHGEARAAETRTKHERRAAVLVAVLSELEEEVSDIEEFVKQAPAKLEALRKRQKTIRDEIDTLKQRAEKS